MKAMQYLKSAIVLVEGREPAASSRPKGNLWATAEDLASTITAVSNRPLENARFPCSSVAIAGGSEMSQGQG